MIRWDGCLTARSSTCPSERRHTASNQLQVTPWAECIKLSISWTITCFVIVTQPKSCQSWFESYPYSISSLCRFCCYPAVSDMSETVQTPFRWVDTRPSKVFVSITAQPLTALINSVLTFAFQEYFYKSQESLATVIDFVEEKVEKKKKRKVGSEMQDGDEEDLKESSNTSTHSSPIFPASRKRPKNLDPRRRLTPWVTGLAVSACHWDKQSYKSEKNMVPTLFHLEHNISQLFKVLILRYFSNIGHLN